MLDELRERDARFWRYVAVAGPDECWLWRGSDINSGGYGRVQRGGHRRLAHRYAFELAHGSTELDVCHTCNVRLCCNIAHLYPDTTAGNLAYMVQCGRQSRGSLRHNARFTEADVRAVRVSLRHGEPQKTIALRYGVAKTTIQAIASRRNWDWLD